MEPDVRAYVDPLLRGEGDAWREVRRILMPDGTIWVTGTHHIIFSLGFALQSMNFKLIKVTWLLSVRSRRYL